MRRQTGEDRQGKKRAYYGTREEWVTVHKNEEEEEAVDIETDYYTRHKIQQKRGASYRTMKEIQV